MWTIFENTHEAIIDQETFDNVQRIRANVRRYPDGYGEIHPLTGLMYVHRSYNGERIPQYEDRIKSEKRRQMEAQKAALRAEDMAKGVFYIAGSVPQQETQKVNLPARVVI